MFDWLIIPMMELLCCVNYGVVLVGGVVDSYLYSIRFCPHIMNNVQLMNLCLRWWPPKSGRVESAVHVALVAPNFHDSMLRGPFPIIFRGFFNTRD